MQCSTPWNDFMTVGEHVLYKAAHDKCSTTHAVKMAASARVKHVRRVLARQMKKRDTAKQRETCAKEKVKTMERKFQKRMTKNLQKRALRRVFEDMSRNGAAAHAAAAAAAKRP
jgi:hypothetical protein